MSDSYFGVALGRQRWSRLGIIYVVRECRRFINFCNFHPSVLKVSLMGYSVVSAQYGFTNPTLYFIKSIGVIWIHVPIVLLKPEKYFYQPMEVETWHNASAGDLSVDIPRAAIMSMPEVFNGKSTCLLDSLSVVYP